MKDATLSLQGENSPFRKIVTLLKKTTLQNE